MTSRSATPADELMEDERDPRPRTFATRPAQNAKSNPDDQNIGEATNRTRRRGRYARHRAAASPCLTQRGAATAPALSLRCDGSGLAGGMALRGCVLVVHRHRRCRGPALTLARYPTASTGGPARQVLQDPAENPRESIGAQGCREELSAVPAWPVPMSGKYRWRTALRRRLPLRPPVYLLAQGL